MMNMIADAHSAIAPDPSTLIDLLRRNAIHKKDRLAYTFLVDGEAEKVELTYGELDRRSAAIGASLQLAGATGERVLLLYPAGLEFITAFLGCLYAGATAVPVYPPKLNRSQFRLHGIVEDSQATMALTTKTVLDGVKGVFSESLCARNLKWLTTDDIISGADDAWRIPEINGDTLAMLQYTSGSTSDPKGVMVSHSNLLSNGRLMRQSLSQNEDSIFVGWLPLYHDMGLMGVALQSLYLGASCVLMSPISYLQKPLRWLKAVSDYRATVSGGPNFAYELCARKISPDQRERLDLSSWTLAFNGAEPISHETLEKFAATFSTCGFRREAFYPCYGLAEGTLFVSGGLKDEAPVVQAFQASALENDRAVIVDGDQEKRRHLVGCGKSPEAQRIAIVRPDLLTECSEGEVGEIWVSGPSVAQGYWRRPEETERAFRAYLPKTGEGPFLRTGDLGFIHGAELFITGRLKDLIIIDGLNHYPQDIELTVEKSHFAIRSGCCAAFSIDCGGREQLIIAAELERHYRNLDHAEIVKTVRQAVAEQHDLRAERVWLLMPGGVSKTSSGKIQRRAVRSNFLSMMDNRSKQE
jgi:acyl-CoA synthetase (AMP-forming)/AMP-acid ligase II